MGFTDWLTSKFTIDTSQRMDAMPLLVRGQFDVARLPDWYGNLAPNWTIWDNDGLRTDAVRKSIVVFACLTHLADAVAESSLMIEQDGVEGWQPALDRPSLALESLLRRPNPHMSEPELLSLLVYQMGIAGYAVVEKVRSGNGLPVQLWPLRADWLSQKRGDDGGWRYEYRSPGLPARPIPAEDLAFIPWRFDDRMERHGIGPVQIAAREIGIDSGLTDFLKTFLDAGGIPPFVLMHDEPIVDDALVDAMQERWRQKYAGSKAYGSLPILHGGYRVEPIGADIDEMAWPDLRSLTELKICQVFRVPPDLVGAREAFKSGNLTTTEAQGAMEQLQRYGASPLRRTIAGALGRELLPEFVGGDPSYRLIFDTSEVLALQEDVDKKHERIRADWEAGLLTLDEARLELDRDELPNGQGQVIKLPFSTILTPVTELIPPLPTITEQTTTTTPVPALPAPAKAARKYRDLATLDTKALEFRSTALRRAQRDRAKLESIGTMALRKFFKQQGQRVINGMLKSGVDFETRDIADLDWDFEERELEAVLRRFYMANGEAAWATASSLLNYDAVWSVNNPRILGLLDILGLRIVGINETTRLQVVDVIADATQEGLGIDQIAEQLTGLFEETYTGRARTIARTETQHAYNLSSALAYAESGEVDDVELHDSSIHCEDYGASDGLSCCDRNGLVVPLGNVSLHVNAEHPNGSLAIMPMLRTPLGAA